MKNRFAAKFLFIAFLGIYFPLIGLAFLVVHLEDKLSKTDLFVITLSITLFVIVITFMILKNLMIPVVLGTKALVDYKNNLTVPRLPINFTDEAGVMLKNIQSTILSNQKLLEDKKELFKLLTDDLNLQTLKSQTVFQNIYNESNSDSVKRLAQEGIQSAVQQLDYVTSFIALMNQETAINAEQIKLKKINVQLFFDELKANFKSDLAAKNIKINYISTVSEVRLKVNLKLLQQAFGYVLDNAIKHSFPDSSIDIHVEKSRGRIIFTIKDYGIGFESSESEKIFTKFDSTISNQKEPLPRIGLYLARQIIERFGGKINAVSGGIEKGATFSLELKLYR